MFFYTSTFILNLRTQKQPFRIVFKILKISGLSFRKTKIISGDKKSLVFIGKFRSSHPEVFLGKGVLKICSKYTGEHPCRSAISIQLLCSFIETALRYGCSENLLHVFRTPFLEKTSEGLLLYFVYKNFLRLHFSQDDLISFCMSTHPV